MYYASVTKVKYFGVSVSASPPASSTRVVLEQFTG